MIAALLGFTYSAMATERSVSMCAFYSVSYRDADPAVGDDFVRNNQARSARGARIMVRNSVSNDIVWAGYAADGGLTPGCTPPITLDDGSSYRVILKSEAWVNGNLLRVVDPSDDLFGVVLDPAFTPGASSDAYFITPVQPHWNVAAMWAWAHWKNPAGLLGLTLEAVVDVDLSVISAGDASLAYLDQGDGRVHFIGDHTTPPTGDKYIIVHELGHLTAFKRTLGLGWVSSYDAPPDICYTDIDRDHEANSKEYQSAAVSEGYAHYYAAIAFNDTEQADCEFRYYKSIDFDLNGTREYEDDDPALSLTPSVSCQDHMPDYLHTMCLWGVIPNRGVEWDWLQFLWDLDAQGGMDADDIFAVFAAASPHDWNEMDGPEEDIPAVRLQGSASLLSYGPIWAWFAAENGTAHE